MSQSIFQSWERIKNNVLKHALYRFKVNVKSSQLSAIEIESHRDCYIRDCLPVIN